MDKTIYLVWQYDENDVTLAVQVYKTKRGAKSAIRKYRELHPWSPCTFDIQKDKISVPFGTDGIVVENNL